MTAALKRPITDDVDAVPNSSRQCAAKRAGNGSNQLRKPRRVYDASFKLMVVREALKLPASNRIKPTCRMYPGVEPVQVRKWIRNQEALEQAAPTAKLVQRVRTAASPTMEPPDLDESSETESIVSISPPVSKRQRAPAAARSRRGDAPLRADVFASLVSVDESRVASEDGWMEEMRAARELLSLGSYSSDESDE